LLDFIIAPFVWLVTECDYGLNNRTCQQLF
jgi:hypothetical protein